MEQRQTQGRHSLPGTAKTWRCSTGIICCDGSGCTGVHCCAPGSICKWCAAELSGRKPQLTLRFISCGGGQSRSQFISEVLLLSLFCLKLFLFAFFYLEDGGGVGEDLAPDIPPVWRSETNFYDSLLPSRSQRLNSSGQTHQQAPLSTR